MEVSIFLARVIGLTSVVSTGAILVHYREFLLLEAQAVKNKFSVYTSGFVFLLMGVSLVVGHSVWVLDWRVVITLLGWAMLLKGLGRLFFPDSITKLVEKKQRHRAF